jgi:hypothetical protein
VKEQTDRRESEMVQKAKNAETRAARKKALVALEREWAKIKADHDAEMDIWEGTCQQLASEKVPKRSWPKRPARPRKPKLPIEDDQDALGDEQGNEESGEDDV